MPLRADKKAASATLAYSYVPTTQPAKIPEVQNPEPAQTPKQVNAPIVTAPTTLPATKKRPGYFKRLFAYSFLCALGCVIWLIDGAFTVLGAVSTVLPLSMMGMIVAIAGHLFLSWGQHEFLPAPNIVVKLIGLILLSANVLSNVFGLMLVLHWIAPSVLKDMPTSENWMSGLWSLLSPQPPSWIVTIVVIIVVSTILAWYAEKICAFLHDQWKLAIKRG